MYGSFSLVFPHFAELRCLKFHSRAEASTASEAVEAEAMLLRRAQMSCGFFAIKVAFIEIVCKSWLSTLLTLLATLGPKAKEHL